MKNRFFTWVEKHFHSLIVPFLHSILWFVAILYATYTIHLGTGDTQEKDKALAQLIPVLIVFFFELSVSLFDIFSERTPSYINISFLRFVAIFIFLIGCTVLPLFICYLYDIHWLYYIALFIAIVLKYMEMWLLNNFDKYELKNSELALGTTLTIRREELAYQDTNNSDMG